MIFASLMFVKEVNDCFSLCSKMQPCQLSKNNKLEKGFANEGLILNIFEHSFEENCPISYSFPRRRSLREIITTKKLAVNASHFLPCQLSKNNKLEKGFANEGLIFNIFEHSFEENCPLAAVNASHFLPCQLSKNNKLEKGCQRELRLNDKI